MVRYQSSNFMTEVECPTCDHRIAVPDVDGVIMKFSAAICQNCKSIISIHVTSSNIYVKCIDSKKEYATIDDENLRDCLMII